MSNTLNIKMLSDWHIGSGTGRPGNIDKLIRRDPDGLPYIPAKTLTGILRDACEQLTWGLDNGTQRQWTQWVDVLFGDQPSLNRSSNPQKPRQALLSIRAAQLPPDLREALKHKPLLKEAIAFVKPSISINAATGCTEPKNLRFEEMVRGNINLNAPYELVGLTDKDRKIATALLCASAALVERIGAKRRRGAGRCKLSISNLQLQDAIATLEQTTSAPSIPAIQTNPNTEDSSGNTEPSSTDWTCYELLLETCTPVIIHKCKIGNLIETLDFIPGTALFPILREQFGINLNDAIAHAELVVTHATPDINGERGLPIPFSLSKEKQNEEKIYNELAPDRAQGERPQLKSLREGYLNTKTEFKELNFEIATHNVIEDTSQRPTAEVGGVYSYEAIPAKQKFRSEVRMRGKTADNRKVNEGPNNTKISIGRAKKDDYGLVKLSNIQKIEKVPSKTVEDTLTVWLLSDLLLRDEWLRPTTDIQDLINELNAELGITLELQEQALFARQRRTDSWQTRWSLPRPSLVGLSAGTCLRLKVTSGTIDPTKLTHLEQSGLGERTVEGYGQLCFNHPLLEQAQPKLSKLDTKVKPSHTGTIPMSPYARQIEREAWRSQIRRGALAIAAKPDSRATLLGLKPKATKPSMSQLGTLRSQLQQLSNPENPFIHWLSALKEKRADKWPVGAITKIETLVGESTAIWESLEETWQDQGIELEQLTMTENAAIELKQELWSEAVITVIEACIQAHKRDSEEGEPNGKTA
jgi:CRISPR-associated protein Csx10